MSSPTLENDVPPKSPLSRRVVIGVGGLLLLALGAPITFGTEVVGVAAIVAVWFWMRRRKRKLTRMGAWFVSVGATALPALVFFAISLASAPTLTPEQRKATMAAAQARRRDSVPEFLKKMMPGQQQQTSAAADSIAQRLLQNKGFMVWMTAMGTVIASGMIALFVGTIGWGATMLLFRAITDDWMGTVALPLAAAVEE
jgi:hypothetical protein